MSETPFQLTTVTRVFAEGTELLEAMGFSEISALEADGQKCRTCFQSKARILLDDASLSPALSLHRRNFRADLEVDSVTLRFDPPRRSPEWEEPLMLRVHFVRWVVDEVCHAAVPGLGVYVFANSPALLLERLEAHLRLVLAGAGPQLSLSRLAQLERVSELRVSQLEVTAHRQTPKQLAMAGEAKEEQSSALSQLAEELPPRRGVAGAGRRNSGKSVPAGVSEPAFELDAELQQLAELLAGSNARSVLLVGPPGCGKTALVRELARRRNQFGFGHSAFWSTSGSRLMTGQIGFGMWQERCQSLCRDISKSQAILHLNGLDELLQVGKASRGEQSVGSFLRPWIARGEVLAIAECTPEQLSMIEREEPHLLGAFQPLSIAARTAEQTRAILGKVLAVSPGEEGKDGAANELALARLHRLHERYATYSANPGRPLRFLKNLLADRFPEKQLTEGQVIAAFSRETGLPPMLLDDEIDLDLTATREWFAQRVLGQPEAVARVVELLVVVKARLARPRKPLGSFLFIGPTGTGKTEMAKSLASFLFGDPRRLVRFDLNEFSDPVSVQRLIGGPLTNGAEGLLTARIREQPFSVVLLDEFEKADRSFFDLLLQILGEGRLTDGSGRVADFCNSVIVMTSNLGAERIQRGPTGFRSEAGSSAQVQSDFSDAVRQFLRPEIYNRLDSIVPFHALTQETVLAIARHHLDSFQLRDGLRLRSIRWHWQPEVAPHLAARGYDVRYGARPLKRAIQQELLVPLAEAINQYRETTALQVSVGLKQGRIQVEVQAQDGNDPQHAHPALHSLMIRLVEQRRRVGQLVRCVPFSRIEDEASMLESLERRLKAGARKAPEIQARLARSPKLRDCMRAVHELSERASQLETEGLALFHGRAVIDEGLLTRELDALTKELRHLKREVFRHQQSSPDDVVLAFYCEDRATLLELALTYYRLALDLGEVVKLDYLRLPAGKASNVTKLLRETPQNLSVFLASPPEELMGVVMHLRGDLFAVRFQSDAGLHLIQRKKQGFKVLVEAAALPVEKYEPPPGIHRQGGIDALGASSCRTYDEEKRVVRDRKLGDRPWAGEGLKQCLAVLTEERLELAVEEATR